MIVIILYLIISIITAKFLIINNWLSSPYKNDFGELFLTGVVSLFWIFFIPIYLIGYIGNFK
jgi:hypothetical protein